MIRWFSFNLFAMHSFKCKLTFIGTVKIYFNSKIIENSKIAFVSFFSYIFLNFMYQRNTRRSNAISAINFKSMPIFFNTLSTGSEIYKIMQLRFGMVKVNVLQFMLGIYCGR